MSRTGEWLDRHPRTQCVALVVSMPLVFVLTAIEAFGKFVVVLLFNMMDALDEFDIVNTTMRSWVQIVRQAWGRRHEQ